MTSPALAAACRRAPYLDGHQSAGRPVAHAVDGAVRAAAQVLQHVHVGSLHVQRLGADAQRGAHVQVARRGAADTALVSGICFVDAR